MYLGTRLPAIIRRKQALILTGMRESTKAPGLSNRTLDSEMSGARQPPQHQLLEHVAIVRVPFWGYLYRTPCYFAIGCHACERHKKEDRQQPFDFRAALKSVTSFFKGQVLVI